MTSSRPYLIRAMYEWIADNNFTPHVVIDAEMPNVQVPEKFVADGRIILNVSAVATQKLIISNEALEFDARFDSGIWHVYTPIPAILAIYARENGRGMIFEDEEQDDDDGGDGQPTDEGAPKKIKPSKPQLKIVK